jgi:hypothetical protein
VLDGSATAVTLSTGRTVALPLRAEAHVAGATLLADRRRLRAATPDGLVPLPVAPRRGVVLLLGAAYRTVGELDPYHEFGAAVPVLVRDDAAGLPRRFAGHVHALPVSTREGCALGVDVWGFPKRVADVTVRRTGERTTVRVREGCGDGRRDLGDGNGDEIDSPEDDDVRRRRSVGAGDEPSSVAFSVGLGGRRRRLSGTLEATTTLRDRLVRVPTRLNTEIAVGLGGGGRVRLALGAGPTAEALRSLGLRGVVLGRFRGRVRASFGAPVAVA